MDDIDEMKFLKWFDKEIATKGIEVKVVGYQLVNIKQLKQLIERQETDEKKS